MAGTPAGLYRIDGVSFERYEPRTGGPFPGRHVRCLLALPNGDLWIGFWPGGISLLRDGNVTNYTARDGTPAGRLRGLVQDGEGAIWAASFSGLFRLEFSGMSAQPAFVDRHLTLWVAAADTLVFLSPGTSPKQPIRLFFEVKTLKSRTSFNGSSSGFDYIVPGFNCRIDVFQLKLLGNRRPCCNQLV